MIQTVVTVRLSLPKLALFCAAGPRPSTLLAAASPGKLALFRTVGLRAFGVPAGSLKIGFVSRVDPGSGAGSCAGLSQISRLLQIWLCSARPAIGLPDAVYPRPTSLFKPETSNFFLF
jgi:hypothetical protein